HRQATSRDNLIEESSLLPPAFTPQGWRLHSAMSADASPEDSNNPIRIYERINMTIETPSEPTAAEKRKAGLAKARAAKAARAKAAETALKFESENKGALDKRRAELLAELAKLPDPAPAPTMASKPGTLVKDGLGEDKVPWTGARLREACNKGETVNGHHFGWVTVIGDSAFPTLSWNGIVYWFFAGIENKIPNVHYEVYKQVLADRQ